MSPIATAICDLFRAVLAEGGNPHRPSEHALDLSECERRQLIAAIRCVETDHAAEASERMLADKVLFTAIRISHHQAPEGTS